YLNRRQQERAERQFQGIYRQALSYAAPSGTVVYEEDPERAKRQAASGYRLVDSGSYVYIPPRPWQVPVKAPDPAFSAQLPNFNTAAGPLFIHARQSPSGNERLVAISMAASQDMQATPGSTVQEFNVHTNRVIRADVFAADRL